MDRRTNGPEGSGGASPTIVTSRAGDDVENDEETLAAGNTPAPARRTPARPAAGTAPVTTAPANGDISDRSANGAVAASDTPASGTDQTTGSPSAAGPAQASGQDGTRGTEADVTLADVPALPADQIGPASSGSSPPGHQTPTVSPAAFAWEMPDPPPSSPSSPARSFLRAGTNSKSEVASRTPAATGPGAGKTTADEDPKSPPWSGPKKAEPKKAGPKKASSKRNARQAHLTVARVEPWSVMKFSFVVSLVAFVILFVAVSLLYGALDGLGVFDSLQRLVSSLTSSQGSAGVNASKWFSASRVLGYTALLGTLNIVLITAMSTIGSVVYNLTSRLIGGVEVTLRETE